MKKLFLIGGMGAGKSTARKALTDEGLAWIDLDQVGHEVLTWDTVKDDLRGAFGDDIFDENGEVVRSALAAKAFATPAATRKLNTITMPRIEERYTDLIDGFEAEGKPAVVVEYSVFRNRQQLAGLRGRCGHGRARAAGDPHRACREIRAFPRRTCAPASLARSPTPTASRPRMSSSTTTAPPRSCATKLSPGGTNINPVANATGFYADAARPCRISSSPLFWPRRVPEYAWAKGGRI